MLHLNVNIGLGIGSSLVTFTQAKVRAIHDAMNNDQQDLALQLLLDLNSADAADVFNNLIPKVREQLIERAVKFLNPGFLLELDDQVKEQLLGKITAVVLAEALTHMDTRDAISIVEDASPAQRQSLLSSLKPEARKLIESGLYFPEDSAGRIADRRPLALPATWTYEKAHSVLRAWKHKHSYIILLDKYSKPESALHIAHFAASTDKTCQLRNMNTEELYEIPCDTHTDDVSFIFRRYKLLISAVVDNKGRLLGTLTPEALLEIEHESAEEDLMDLTGAVDSDFTTPAWHVAHNRLKWLGATVTLSLVSGTVISWFAPLISAHVELACMLPAILSLGGAAMTQTSGTITCYILNKQISTANIQHVLWREIKTSIIKGLLLGTILFARCATLSSNWITPSAVGITFMTLVLWSSLIGVLAPFLAYRIGLNPATTAGPLLPVTADIMGTILLFELTKLLLAYYC